MNRVHISRHACARVITRTRAREGKDPPTTGGSLILALGHLGEEPEADGVVSVDPEAAETVSPLPGDLATTPEGVARGAVRLLAYFEAVCFVFRREFAAPLPIPCLFGQREVGVDGGGVVEVVGV